MSKEVKGFAIKDNDGNLIVPRSETQAWDTTFPRMPFSASLKRQDGWKVVPVSIKEDEGEEGSKQQSFTWEEIRTAFKNTIGECDNGSDFKLFFSELHGLGDKDWKNDI